MDKGKRITGAAREKIAAQIKTAYENGASIRAIAQDKERSYGFVHRILTEADVTLRGRGGANRSEPGSVTS
ncbi:helix-turn-helix domain-containing protein [Streptomyces sp. NPDC005349]|uniref:helix-turn-helix domain-containing protein n=1 Tax=Streptomyces sp. NPDC005349 TaxID=3157037 RepID=UPI00339FED89